MNQAEIMTLLAGKVKKGQIRTAILAGKVSGILNAAERQIDQAQDFEKEAVWKQILTILEGEAFDRKDHKAEDKPLNKF